MKKLMKLVLLLISLLCINKAFTMQDHINFIRQAYTPNDLRLLVYARENNTQEVSLALSQPVDTEIYDDHGNTPLLLACLHKNLLMIGDLLQHGAKVDTANYQGQSPLSIAIKNNFSSDEILLLLQYSSKNNPNLLNQAIDSYNIEAVKAFLLNRQFIYEDTLHEALHITTEEALENKRTALKGFNQLMAKQANLHRNGHNLSLRESQKLASNRAKCINHSINYEKQLIILRSLIEAIIIGPCQHDKKLDCEFLVQLGKDYNFGDEVEEIITTIAKDKIRKNPRYHRGARTDLFSCLMQREIKG